MTPELQNIAQRLEEVEKQVAHLAAIVTEHSDTERRITAQGFVVEDSQGRRRAELAVVPVEHGRESPWLGLFDEDGKLRICLGAEGREGPTTGPWLELYSPKGRTAVEVEGGPDGPLIRMFDANGSARLVANVSPSGDPHVAMSDANGKLRVILEVAPTGEPGLIMYDGNAEPRLDIGVEQQGPQLRFRDNANGPWSPKA